MKAYDIWLGNVMFPVAPETLETKVEGDNKTINLINEAEVNQIKGNKLTSFSFDLEIPCRQLPYAVYLNGFQKQEYFLKHLENLKNLKTPFKFKVLRNNGEYTTFDTSIDVTLESYTIKEDANNGFDIVVSIELKKYVKFGTMVVKVIKNKIKKYKIDTNKKKIVFSYKTKKKGETIKTISKKVYGKNTTNNCSAIYKKNKSKIDKSLKSKFKGKFSRRIYTTGLKKGIKLSIPKG